MLLHLHTLGALCYMGTHTVKPTLCTPRGKATAETTVVVDIAIRSIAMIHATALGAAVR